VLLTYGFWNFLAVLSMHRLRPKSEYYRTLRRDGCEGRA
jgi:hypothetical protein